MKKCVVVVGGIVSLLGLGSASPRHVIQQPIAIKPAVLPGAARPVPPPLPQVPVVVPPPTPAQALESGVLIVVSLPEQRAYVFRKGEVWDSTPVSTGKRGKETPTGTFTILQKKKLNHSTLYDGAPMPFMQRLTWDGVALHAGSLPGYAASHGCVRLPRAFAKKLYDITNFTSTVVLITDESIASRAEARELV